MKYVKTYEQLKDGYYKDSQYLWVTKDEKFVIDNTPKTTREFYGSHVDEMGAAGYIFFVYPIDDDTYMGHDLDNDFHNFVWTKTIHQHIQDLNEEYGGGSAEDDGYDFYENRFIDTMRITSVSLALDKTTDFQFEDFKSVSYNQGFTREDDNPSLGL